MDHAMGAISEGDFRLDFDRRVRLEFHGSRIKIKDAVANAAVRVANAPKKG
jgi:hypothetical protein